MFCTVRSLGLSGVNGYEVTTECDLSGGLPAFDIVGLPDAAVKEAKDRVRSAIKNCGFSYPVSRVTVNLAPANVKKIGTLYDLPILLGILSAGGQIPPLTEDSAFIGELSLAGQVRPAAGVLPMALCALRAGIKRLYVPAENAPEATLAEGLEVYPVTDVAQLVAHLNGEAAIAPEAAWVPSIQSLQYLDFADVKGQEGVKRALEIAAAGGHHVLMVGPPGSGKSMLAKRLPSILPDMTRTEAMETTEIHSVMGMTSRQNPLVTQRPFRAPHHTLSSVAMIGGGQNIRPGEISLAHNGVIFLDELPEFQRETLEALRAPLEDEQVQISRISGTAIYPARFMMVCAMNPCKCGWYGHPKRACRCSDAERQRYADRISGPILDRIDIHVNVQSLLYDELVSTQRGDSSEEIRARVNAARSIQVSRFADCGITCNSHMQQEQLRMYCKLDEQGSKLMKRAYDKMHLTGRSYDRILRVARTIVDLSGSEQIEVEHLAEALQYRPE